MLKSEHSFFKKTNRSFKRVRFTYSNASAFAGIALTFGYVQLTTFRHMRERNLKEECILQYEIWTKLGSDRELSFLANGPKARVMLSSKTENGKSIPLGGVLTDAEKTDLTEWVINLISRISSAGYLDKNGKTPTRMEQRNMVEEVCDGLLGKKTSADSACKYFIDGFTRNQYSNCVILKRTV